MIQCFIKHTSEIINIPLKLTLKGFKIWVLANKGYILDQLYHTKGNKKSPVDFNIMFIKEKDFLKMQAVVFNLLTQCDLDTNKSLYFLRHHIVQLNNLFTSVKLLTRLCGLEIKNVGIV